MSFYRIRDWNRHFENNRTRELKRMEWLPVKNKHDGWGFTQLLDHPNGMAHYGAWHLLLQVASKCTPRGSLVRDDASGQSTALTCGEIGTMSHGSAAVFEEAIPRLVSIGWIEVCGESRHSPAPSCGEVTMRENGMEGNGMEGEREGAHTFAEIPSFKEWWEYCKQIGLIAEWYAQDKFLAAQQDNWKGKSNWRGYATRCRTWWESDNRPMSPPIRKNGNVNQSNERPLTDAEILNQAVQ